MFFKRGYKGFGICNNFDKNCIIALNMSTRQTFIIPYQAQEILAEGEWTHLINLILFLQWSAPLKKVHRFTQNIFRKFQQEASPVLCEEMLCLTWKGISTLWAIYYRQYLAKEVIFASFAAEFKQASKGLPKLWTTKETIVDRMIFCPLMFEYSRADRGSYCSVIQCRVLIGLYIWRSIICL